MFCLPRRCSAQSTPSIPKLDETSRTSCRYSSPSTGWARKTDLRSARTTQRRFSRACPLQPKREESRRGYILLTRRLFFARLRPKLGTFGFCDIRISNFRGGFMRRTWFLSIFVSLLFAPLLSSSARAQANFYEGKTVNVYIGAKSGSLAIAAQIVAHHLGKYLPGKPAVVVQYMPGAAHLLATNHVFNVAKPDGLTLLAANPNVAIAQLSKIEQVRFDVRKFLWIGSSGADGVAFSIRSDLPYKTFDELKKADKELVAGTTGPGSNAHDFPLLLKEFAGLKLKLVSS